MIAVDEQEAGQEDHHDDDIHRDLVGEIDDAEQFAARHRLDAVFAAGELRLQREEEHHLRERERDHREIDALAADRERAGHDAERAAVSVPVRIASSGGKPHTLAACADR